LLAWLVAASNDYIHKLKPEIAEVIQEVKFLAQVLSFISVFCAVC
jgi:hypothetical protein